jgi:hypothetical protein
MYIMREREREREREERTLPSLTWVMKLTWDKLVAHRFFIYLFIFLTKADPRTSSSCHISI